MLRRRGYDDWLTIEAFGGAAPAILAAKRVWRRLFADPAEVYSEGIALIRRAWTE
jgi:D-psicose/D-tagatose/L-ribulose 3-epimerase